MSLPVLMTMSGTSSVSNELLLPEKEYGIPFFSDGIDLSSLEPQCGCGGSAKPGGCGCGGSRQREGDTYLYVFGDIRVKLPSQSVENEFYNVAVTDPADKSRPFAEIAYKYLSRTENIYIARDMSWIFTIRGSIDLYMINVQTDRDLALLIEAIAPRPTIDYDILIGVKTGSVKAESATGDSLPAINYLQIYNITYDQYVAAIMAAAPGCSKEQAGQFFSAALALTNNTGDEDKYRALNFIVLRYMKFYTEMYRLKYVGEDISVPPGQPPEKEYYDLVSVTTNGVEVFGKKKIIEIIFSFHGQKTSLTKMYSLTLDVAREFPFVDVHWSQYFRGI